MQLAWLWIPVALAVTAVIVGSLVVMSVVEHRRHEREALELEANGAPFTARTGQGRRKAA
jgi:hypothetical protein